MGVRYGEAQLVSNEIEKQIQEDTKKWNAVFLEKLEKRKELLVQRQKTEYESLKKKLQKSIDEKISLRAAEYDKYSFPASLNDFGLF